jgi:uroporphyrinogen decarboxylase
MKELSSEERILRTLELRETDKVPTFEWAIDKKVIEALKPGSSYEKFCYEMDIDAICVECDYENKIIEGDLIEDEWGIVKKNTGEAHTYPVNGPVKSIEDAERYIGADPHKKGRYISIEKMIEEHKGKKALILHLNDVFSIPSRLMPFETFLVKLMEEPELIKILIKKTVDANLIMAKEAVKRGIKIIYTGDDYAYNSGLIVSPEKFNEVFLPELKRVVKGYKELGLKVIKHTDGFIMSIMNLIVEAGFDCIDPIDPIAGMSLQKVKSEYGKRICIKGNVDCSETLTFKGVEETIEETKKCLEIGMDGGGYILSSSNSIHSAVKPENYQAMLETLKQFGKY